jgi:hypothetical protein
MKTKVRKKMSWDDHGVSEIIADILILMMTVVLFAIIFAFVWSMPAPNEATYADMEGSIQLDANGGTIQMTHLSGEDLREAYTEIYLYKNGAEDIRILLTKKSPPTGDPDNPTGYGLEGDSTWSPGETWEYYMVDVKSTDDLEIKIWDSQVSHLIHSQVLIGAGMNDAPIIMDSRVLGQCHGSGRMGRHCHQRIGVCGRQPPQQHLHHSQPKHDITYQFQRQIPVCPHTY